MPDNTQPTILVKKADGATARMTLDEIKKMKQGAPAVSKPAAPPIPATVAPQPVPKPEIKEEKLEEKIQSQKQAVAREAVVAAIKAPPKGEGAKSLLEEEPPITNAPLKVSPTRANQVDEVIKKLSFRVPANFANRLRSVIQLRIKEVRGETETKNLVLRSIADGGLGLTEAQAEELEKICASYVGSAPSSTASAVLPANITAQPIKKFEEPLTPAKDTPFNSFVHAPIKSALDTALSASAPAVPAMPAPAPVIAPLKSEAKSNLPPVKLPPTESSAPVLKKELPANKQSVQDVTAGRPAIMNPLDEIKYFTLTDFRRLSSKPEEAMMRLKQKFINLKEESYLLFLEAKNAWTQSPLYNHYLAMVEDALHKKTGLAAVLGEKEKITMAEISVIIKMEKELSL